MSWTIGERELRLPSTLVPSARLERCGAASRRMDREPTCARWMVVPEARKKETVLSNANKKERQRKQAAEGPSRSIHLPSSS